MLKEECFAIWAPPGGLWSPWAKPVLFTQLSPILRSPLVDLQELSADEFAGVPSPGRAALILDLPGDDSVRACLAVARIGYRPVPLYNVTDGLSPVLDVTPIMRGIAAATVRIQDLHLPANAPPAFLLDADRMTPKILPNPGKFDNRWVALPQDFPSATFLLAHGISEALLLQRSRAAPRDDLTHVLLRWQGGGVRLAALNLNQPGSPEPLTVARPSLFRRAWYQAVVLTGLRRNNIGGFGSHIPEETSGGGGFYG
jgi:hypothetical protein